MKTALTMTLMLAMCTSAATAQRIGVFADQGGYDCGINPSPFSLVTIYVVLMFSDGSTAAKFKINEMLGLTPTGTGVTAGYISMGTFYEGIEIAFPTCIQGNHVLGSLGFFHQFEVMDCLKTIEVVPHPNSEIPGEILVVDCTVPSGVAEPVPGGRAFGGSDEELCGGCWGPLPGTESSTWGKVKALYR